MLFWKIGLSIWLVASLSFASGVEEQSTDGGKAVPVFSFQISKMLSVLPANH